MFLVCASLFFYGYFTPKYIFVITTSIIVNFFISKLFKNNYRFPYEGVKRKILLAAAVIINIGCLFIFKYYDFFISTVNGIFKSDFTLLHLLLPLGISFFTFQQLSFVIDSYYGKTPDYSFLDYSLFVSYFPQLIAGPIVTHDEMVPQFEDEKNKHFNIDNFAKGLYAFSLGLAKKVLLADVFGLLVDAIFPAVEGIGTSMTIITMLSYTFQIYFDFSGYCDMATGIAKMMNIDITQNFNSPYRAVNIVEFWKRWHITLTRFFTRYIYIPLGGNRKGTLITYRNIFIVFLVSGIWHGANWTFIIWGVLHGVFNIITRIADEKIQIQTRSKIIKALSWGLTFSFINLTWVIFRADDLKTTLLFFKELFTFKVFSLDTGLLETFRTSFVQIVTSHIPLIGDFLSINIHYIFISLGLIMILFFKNTNDRLSRFRLRFYSPFITAVLLFLSIMSLAGVSSFLYWNF